MNAFTLKNEGAGVYTLFFDTPNEKVNKLSTNVFLQLDGILNELVNLHDIKYLIFRSKKEGFFIVGADINEIANIENENVAKALCGKGLDIIKKIEKLPFPTIAVIDGVCMGGGLELALAFKYRIATDDINTKIALPEVKIGLFPGLGGTQRLPRLIGLRNALPLILTGKTINGVKAKKLKLVDECYHKEYLDRGIDKFINKIIVKPKYYKKKRKRGGLGNFLLEKNFLGRALIYKSAKKSILKNTKGKYPAPLMALKTVKKGYWRSLKSALKIETKYFSKIACMDITKYLIRLFFISEKIKKFNGVDTITAKSSAKLEKVGVLGAGIMGAGISWLFSKNDIDVILKDVDNANISKGLSTCKSYYDYFVRSRKMKSFQVHKKMLNITGQVDFNGFKHTDIVIEAVYEDLDIKTNVLKETEANISDDTILATNTSSIPITKMAVKLSKPERFIGMHFFNPVNRMPLVEVIIGTLTNEEAVKKTVEVAKQMGKIPIVVKDSPGFLVNRILLPYMNEAAYLMQEGVKPNRIDKVLRKFGMPMGPMELLDEVGIDVAYKVSKIFDNAFGERMQSAPVLKELFEEMKLKGKKTGKGIYIYKKKSKKVNKALKEIYSKKDKIRITNNEIRDRLIYRMINEAVLCLEENIVSEADYLDMAMIIGTGFPAYKGGILKYADKVGVENIFDALNHFKTLYGIRFTSCELLNTYAKNNGELSAINNNKKS